MIRYLADTSILGYFARRTYSPLQQRMQQALSRQEMAISVITRAETRLGLARLDASDKRRQLVDLLLQDIPALPWNADAADRCGEIAALLGSTGRSIGEMDTMIAAHALVAGLPVITHNTRHFSRVPGLQMEDWTL